MGLYINKNHQKIYIVNFLISLIISAISISYINIIHIMAFVDNIGIIILINFANNKECRV